MRRSAKPLRHAAVKRAASLREHSRVRIGPLPCAGIPADHGPPTSSWPGQVLQEDAAHLAYGGRALLRAVVAREDGLRSGPIDVGTPERDDQVSRRVTGELEGDRVVRHPRRHRLPADGQEQQAIDPEVADRVDRRAPGSSRP